MHIHAALHEAKKALKASNNSGEEKLEAQLLLEHVLKVNHAWLISHADDEIDAKANATLNALVKRRMTGEPIAHILGEREFYGLPFKVTPDTLIPRPDTETLVESALAKIPNNETCHILDLGTGTGAIALAIAKHKPLSQVAAVDASEKALKVAVENAVNLGINNITFTLSNWFYAIQDQNFDVIVSNPPYIESDDPHLSKGDLRFEPLSALASGKDGLDDIRQIIQQAPDHLNTNGWLMLEHGYNQASAVAVLLKAANFIDIAHATDLAGIERVTLGRIA